MSFDIIVEDYIRQCRPRAHAELRAFEELDTLEQAIRHSSLCHLLPSEKRHPHQYRIPARALKLAEKKLQAIRSRLARARSFEVLHTAIDQKIGDIYKIGPLAVYDIAHRIGAYLGLRPALVYLHRGTLTGARALGFSGRTLDPRSLPRAFSRLKPWEIEDCLCIYKGQLRAAGYPGDTHRKSVCIVPVAQRSECQLANGAVRRRLSRGGCC